MRINCPLCGERDRREFYYLGAADYLDRPQPTGNSAADQEAMHRYLHIRANPAGFTRDLWHHEAGCAAWLVVERNVSTHEILSVTQVASQRGKKS